MGMEGAATPAWQDQLYDLLRQAGVSIFSYVPDAGHNNMILRAEADPGVTAVTLTNEMEGVALAAGAHLGGARSVLLMQSSGTGNCINMLSLIQHGRFPFLTFISMRGDFGEGNAWQFPMGRAVQPVLEAMGVLCHRVDKPEQVIATAQAAVTMAFQAEMPVAVILSQQLIGAKAFKG